MYDHLKFGLAKRLAPLESKQLDVELSGVLADITDDLECLGENMKLLRGLLNVVFYAEPRTLM